MPTDFSWEALLDFVRANEPLIELIVFVLGFAESLVFVSFFVPASVLFLGIAALQSASDAPLMPLLLAGTAGALIGDIVSYGLGWRVRHNVDRVWPFSANPHLLFRTRKLFESQGAMAIVLSKFVGPLRPLVPFVGGAMHMPFPTFAIASALSSLAWSIAFLAPSYYGVNWLMQ